MVHAVVSARQLHAGQQAEIASIVGQADHVHRLEEMGLRGGTLIEIFRAGNPCILRTSGNKLCLRWDQHLDILVRNVDGSSCEDKSRRES